MSSIANVIIAENVSGGAYEVGDLGVGFPTGGQVTLTDMHPIEEIRLSNDLAVAVADEDIVLNNGTDDLTQQEAEDWFAEADGGYATLDEDGQIPENQLPPSVGGFGGALKFALSGVGKPYFSATSAHWKTGAYFRFPGTNNVGIPSALNVVVERLGSSASVRVWDVTNNNLIAIVTPSNNDPDIETVTSFSDLPSAEAVFRLDAKKSKVSFVEFIF